MGIETVQTGTPAHSIQPRGSVTSLNSDISLKSRVQESLDSNPEFRRARFEPGAPSIARILDRDYQEQLCIEAEREATRLYSYLIAHGKDEAQATEEAISRAVQMAISARDEWRELWDRCEGKFVIAAYGSARSRVWNDQLESFLKHLASEGVKNGYSVINGGACTGVMGRVSRAWRNEIDAQSQKGEAGTSSEVILVLLRFHGESTEKPSSDGSEGFVTRALESFLSRTPALYALGIRSVELYFPGGIGTLEEMSRYLAEVKIGKGRQRRNLRTFFSHQPTEPTGLFLSARFKGVGNFWKGMEQQFGAMVKAGAARRVDFRCTCFDELEDPKTLSEVIISHMNLLRDRRTKEEKRRKENLSEAERGVVRAVNSILQGDLAFNQRIFTGGNATTYERLLNAHYKEQVMLEAEELVLEEFRRQRKKGISLNDAVDRSINKAVEMARKWRGQLKGLIGQFNGHKTVVFVGSAKDEVWNRNLEESMKKAVRKAVTRGYTIVVGGDGREGLSKRLRDEWFEAKKRFRQERGEDSKSDFVRLQLKINGEKTGAHSRYGYSEIVGPPLESLSLRTALLASIGRTSAFYIYPGGPTELEVASSIMLAVQLQQIVTTPFSGRPLPMILFMNAALNRSGRFWDGLRKQLLTMTSEEIRSADPPVLDHIKFLDV
ncbi:MAG: hypothetical protein D6808_06345 [Candidatus Dadabacteria bacterium]|nr:MAG: hypothetical protein D6808_06345 [Candidatus Dadabacteria bacterium]